MKMFKLQGTGLDLRNPTKNMITPLKDDRATDFGVKYIEYVLIDLLEGKEWYTGELVEDSILNGASVIAYVDMSKLPKTDDKDEFKILSELLEEWRTSSVNSSTLNVKLLALENVPEGKVINQKEWMGENIELGLVIQTPLEGKEILDKWKMIFGEYPKNVFRPISPLLYSPEFEEKLANEKIITWGLDWNGGDLSKEVEYSAFTKSYLLSFSAFHSSVVLIPTHIGAGVDEVSQLEFLQPLKFREMREKEDAKFILKKSVSRLVKKPKKVVHESINILDWKLPVENSSLINHYQDLIFSFSSPTKKFEKSEWMKKYIMGDIELNMLDLISNLKPEAKLSEELYWRYLTMLGYDFLRSQFIKPDEENLWEMEVYEPSQHVLMFSLTKYKKRNWFTRNLPKEVEDSKFFLLAMDNPDKTYFLDLEKVNEIDENADLVKPIP